MRGIYEMRTVNRVSETLMVSPRTLKEGTFMMQSQRSNNELEPTVIRRRVRAASVPVHYAIAARWTAQRAAAQLQR